MVMYERALKKRLFKNVYLYIYSKDCLKQKQCFKPLENHKYAIIVLNPTTKHLHNVDIKRKRKYKLNQKTSFLNNPAKKKYCNLFKDKAALYNQVKCLSKS